MKLDNLIAANHWTDKRQTQLLQKNKQHPWLTRFMRFGIMSQETYQPVILQTKVNLEGADVYQKRRPATKRHFYEPCQATPVRHWEWQQQPLTDEPMWLLLAVTRSSNADRSMVTSHPIPIPSKPTHQLIKTQKLSDAMSAPACPTALDKHPTWEQNTRNYGNLAVQTVKIYQLTKPYYDPNARNQKCRRVAQILTDRIKQQNLGMFNITDYAPLNES